MHKSTTHLRVATAALALGVATVALALLVALGLLASSASAATKGDPTVDKHSRAYVGQAFNCEVYVAMLRLDINRGASDLKLADVATTARDSCEAADANLVSANTDHFDDQATNLWYGVDRYKSGLNAFLAYLDSGAVTKAIEVRNKLQQGDQYVKLGLRGINQRRKVYGLKPISDAGF